MNVFFVSQCSKNALTETRRILDQFAERRGDRTWQTPITQQGLNVLHKMLRKTARKNTAVACHWIRGRDHSELLWIVGDAGRFSVHGATPTNTTTRDILRTERENDWHTAEEIRLLTELVALWHDFGKGNQAFIRKLASNKPKADAFRHEWVSLRLFEAFVGSSSDHEWLDRLANINETCDKNWIKRLVCDGLSDRPQSPFSSLPPLAHVIGWMIVSHHRLPVQEKKAPIQVKALAALPAMIEDQWCGSRSDVDKKEIKSCWTFKKGVPFDSLSWRRHIAKTARRIIERQGFLDVDWLKNTYVTNLSRLALMLADHYYSSEPSHQRYGDADHPIYANTDRATGDLKQRLDEHLIGVAVSAKRIARTLPRLEQRLPRIARHIGFRRRSKDTRFRWQDRAFDLAGGLRDRTAKQGFFGVNMASTGCGKTLANGRIMYALAHPQHGARFSVALGLRTLTLQTGDAYRERLGLGSEDLAVLVGGGAVRELHEHWHHIDKQATHGSESSAELLPDYQYVHFDGSLEDGPLNRWLGKNTDAQKLLNAPILVCTIDHLIPATESTRGGHQIAPMLRLLTSDLVLDEPDDFGIEDLPALTRLVHWAGLLGSRMLLSSATLPPAFMEGLFQAYLEGRRIFQANRGIPDLPVNICCAWFDEFSVMAGDHAELPNFIQMHQKFVDKRLSKLSQAEIRRRAEIPPLTIDPHQDRDRVCAELAEVIGPWIHKLHRQHHSIDPTTGKRISFGLIRMANIDPLVETARDLFLLGAKEHHHIHLCIYHSQHPFLVRSAIERRLDRLLNRKSPSAVFQDHEIRSDLDGGLGKDHIFVVIATAVAEVGRDHDYDWAIVEPSSMRSIIQLAGRIRRHRPGPCLSPNLFLMNTNIRNLVSGARAPAFCRPGFESNEFPLETRYLTELLTDDQLPVIDASSRIKENDTPQPRRNLADLEHERLRAVMIGTGLGERVQTQPVHLWWTTRASLSGELQRSQPFRDDPMGHQRYGLLPDENENIGFFRFETDGRLTAVGNLKHDKELVIGPNISVWGEPDYQTALENLADTLRMEINDCARRFGIIDLPAKGTEQGWNYHQALGFSRFH